MKIPSYEMEGVTLGNIRSDGEHGVKPHHYFVASGSNWKTGEDMYDCIKTVIDYDLKAARTMGMASTECSVWFIPLPSDAKYSINEYTPIVQGAICVGRIDYNRRVKRSANRKRR